MKAPFSEDFSSLAQTRLNRVSASRYERFLWPTLSILFLIVVIAIHGYWIVMDNSPFGGDQILHAQRTLELYALLDADQLSLTAILSTITTGHPFPPVSYLLTFLLYLINGPTPDTALYTNLFFIVLLWIGAKQLTDELGGNGWLAATVVIAFPLNLVFARLYFLDLHLASSISLAYYYLTRCRFLRKRDGVTQAALWTIVALLTKWSAVFFLVPGAFFSLCPIYSPDRNESMRIRPRLMMRYLVIVVLGAGPWYLNNFSAIKGRFELSLKQQVPSFLLFDFDPIQVMDFLPSIFGFAFLVLLGLYFLRNWDFWRRYQSTVLVLSIGIPLIVFSFLTAKWPRYLAPLTPFAASAIAMPWIRKSAIRVPYTLFVLTTAALMLLSVGLIARDSVPGALRDVVPSAEGLHVDHLRSNLQRDLLDYASVYDQIIKAVPSNSKCIIVPFYTEWLSPQLLHLERCYQYPGKYVDFAGVGSRDGKLNEDGILSADYVFTKRGNQLHLAPGRTPAANIQFYDIVSDILVTRELGYGENKIVSCINLPDNTVGALWRIDTPRVFRRETVSVIREALDTLDCSVDPWRYEEGLVTSYDLLRDSRVRQRGLGAVKTNGRWALRESISLRFAPPVSLSSPVLLIEARLNEKYRSLKKSDLPEVEVYSGTSSLLEMRFSEHRRHRWEISLPQSKVYQLHLRATRSPTADLPNNYMFLFRVVLSDGSNWSCPDAVTLPARGAGESHVQVLEHSSSN